MIDFAKSPGVTNSDALIANAVAYRQHPRNALNILGVVPSTPFCQRAPRNQELVGVVNNQLPGVNPGIFGGPSFGLVAFGGGKLIQLKLEIVPNGRLNMLSQIHQHARSEQAQMLIHVAARRLYIATRLLFAVSNVGHFELESLSVLYYPIKLPRGSA